MNHKLPVYRGRPYLDRVIFAGPKLLLPVSAEAAALRKPPIRPRLGLILGHARLALRPADSS